MLNSQVLTEKLPEINQHLLVQNETNQLKKNLL